MDNSNRESKVTALKEEQYVPKNLYLRLSRRHSAKYFIIFYFFLLVVMIILGALFLHSVYLTRNYIVNGDVFWEKPFQNPKMLRIQSFSAFTGVFLICVGVFSIMNNILVIGHIYAGGLKRRLQYASFVFLFFQVIVFLYAFVTLIMFTNLIVLYPIFFTFSFFNVLNSVIYFLLVRRCVIRENLFMLSIRRMESHKEEFRQEYLSKNNLKEIIPGS